MPGHDGREYVRGYEAARSYIEMRLRDEDSPELGEIETRLRTLDLGDSLYLGSVADESYLRGFNDFLWLTRQHARNVLDDLAELRRLRLRRSRCAQAQGRDRE